MQFSHCDTNMIKSASEFLSVIEQQKVFLLRNKLPVEVVYQLESVILGNQLSLCSKQKEVTDYFSSSQSPKPKSQRSFRSTADLSGNLTIVDSLSDVGSPFDDIEGMQFDTMAVDTSIASVAASALMRHDILPEFISMPKPKCKRCNSQNKDTIASPTLATSQDKRSLSSSASPTPMTSQDKRSLSSSVIKQKIMARAHSAKSHVIPALTSSPEVTQTRPEMAETSVPKAISSTPAEQKVKTIKKTKKVNGPSCIRESNGHG